jgi:hypothetical protein
VARGLEKDPAERFQSVAELQREIRDILRESADTDDAPAGKGRPNAKGPASPSGKRRSALIAIAAAVLGFGGVALALVLTSTPSPEAASAALPSSAGKPVDEAAKPSVDAAAIAPPDTSPVADAIEAAESDVQLAKAQEENDVLAEATEVDIGPVPVKLDPFKDFPKRPIKGARGDFALVPSKNWIEDATVQGSDNVSFIFYNQKIDEIGEAYSRINFMFDEGVEVPNYLIVPIRPQQKARKGDIVLTWWQSGSGMMRAIVTDDSNPLEPMVNYIDLDWDNPAKHANGLRIGQKIERLKPNSFHVLSAPFEPGTTVAVREGSRHEVATVISVAEDKVLVSGFAGRMKVVAKSNCTPAPVKVVVRKGDKALAPLVASFESLTVEKVDTKMGRVWFDHPYTDESLVVPFGDIFPPGTVLR